MYVQKKNECLLKLLEMTCFQQKLIRLLYVKIVFLMEWVVFIVEIHQRYVTESTRC
ncbi:hypothetical protein LCM23_19300 [Cytobacillus kochii]|uniref:hypothetical protein n=1 Tax=Cytobacillus kochii TaxID=859143 RepID=UPI001CD5B04A|nr:hypothetical protein [Cytobacillus kochii]MCA1028212.1 hypothetical protein [Cytobacillus kochii]